METKTSWALLSFLFSSRGARASKPVAKYSREGRLCSRAGTQPPSVIFTAPLKGIPITSMQLGALRNRVCGAMSVAQNILPADFRKRGKAWSGRLHPIDQEDIARLYLGLTWVREGDRQRGLKEIESGMRGINSFLDNISQTQRYSIGQYWDPDREIRSAIQRDLAMISGKDLDWQKLTADTEWLAIQMEQESDLARRQDAEDRTRWRSD